MYRLHGYGRMIADKIRMEAYVTALRQALTPQAVVCDLGTGVGLFALLACAFGARHAYAIDPAKIITVARELAIANGYAERITYIPHLSTQTTLPEPVDVLIADLRGILPLFGQHIPALMDARQRFLRPQGRLIPQYDTLWGAVVHAPQVYDSLLLPWEDHPAGISLQPARRRITNVLHKVQGDAITCLTPAQQWAVLEYPSITSPNVRGCLHWITQQAGTAHGLCLWFDTCLIEGVHFSNAPDAAPCLYGQAFFPWTTPVALVPGDVVSVTLDATLVGHEYIWRWHTQVTSAESPTRLKADLRQSTFYGEPRPAQALHKQQASYTPTRSAEGHIDHQILSMIDGHTSLEVMAHRLAAQFPARFPSWQQALGRVGALVAAYDRP